MTKWRVTRPITKYGVYYAAGSIQDDSSSVVGSLQRMYHWEKVAAGSDRQKPSSPASVGLEGLSKADLFALAADRGVNVPGRASKSDIRELLES